MPGRRAVIPVDTAAYNKEMIVAEETIPQMRERIEEQNKELSKLRRENRTLSAKELFREKGYSPSHAELFTASVEGDITPEAVDEFVTKFDLTPAVTTEEAPEAEAQTEEEAPAPDPGEGLAEFSGGGSRSGSGGAATPGSKTVTKEQWRELQKTDPAAARALLEQGRVELNAGNFYVKSGLYGN